HDFAVAATAAVVTADGDGEIMLEDSGMEGRKKAIDDCGRGACATNERFATLKRKNHSVLDSGAFIEAPTFRSACICFLGCNCVFHNLKCPVRRVTLKRLVSEIKEKVPSILVSYTQLYPVIRTLF